MKQEIDIKKLVIKMSEAVIKVLKNEITDKNKTIPKKRLEKK